MLNAIRIEGYESTWRLQHLADRIYGHLPIAVYKKAKRIPLEYGINEMAEFLKVFDQKEVIGILEGLKLDDGTTSFNSAIQQIAESPQILYLFEKIIDFSKTIEG